MYDEDLELPVHMRMKNKSRLSIKTEDLKWHDITIADVVKYFKYEANNITSGCRKLADIVGDWRPIDYIAQDCLEVFKRVNTVRLRNAAKKAGLTPKF